MKAKPRTGFSTKRSPKESDIQLDIGDWIAECQSLEPNRQLDFTFSSSWDAICLLYLLSHISDFYWITDRITQKIAQKAFLYNYEGEWATVQDFLESDVQTPKQFYEKFLQYRNPEEFFGNLQKRARRLLRIKKYLMMDPHGPVRKPQRARGYKDKGTLRPVHQHHGDPPLKGTDREDRRGMCFHPLLRQIEKTQME